MKRPLLSLIILACSTTLAGAAQLYDITLSNAEKYSQCRILYGGRTMTKFSGKDRSGNVVTKEVKTTNILYKKAVAEEKAEEPAPTPETPAETTTADTETTSTETGAESTEAAATEQNGEAPAAEQTVEVPADAYAAESADRTAKAKDATLRLRETLAKVDTEFNSITKPTTNLKSSCNYTKKRVTDNLAKMDATALEVAKLQEQYNDCSADYVFSHVSSDQRDKYVQDGQAAHKAMLVDMKERKGARKIGGLDKFELMRERYQGIPEYKQAFEWYGKTLKDLESKWTGMFSKEEKRRKTALPAKKEAMADTDDKEYDRLAEQLEKDGDDIATTWINPNPRNLRMLRTALNKVKDARRRSEGLTLSEHVGTVPSLIEQYWAAMDEARRHMVAGDFEGAEAVLDKDGSFRNITSLGRQLLPDEYKKPLISEHADLEKEIRRRSRARNDLKRKLESRIADLERSVASAESQLSALLESIEREKELDTGDNTVDAKKGQEDAAPEEQAAAGEPAQA